MTQPRYRILERIDFGGMAEVFRGVSTIEGFDRTVAIKRVLPGLTHKRKFMRMFMDEARLALQLTHANIVPVFDIGVADDTSFIVMEFVEGVNLRDVLDETYQLQAPVPVPVAVFIAAEICKGLAYAHDRKDASGDPLGIVHRDVSPPNILLSVQGEVKIADFGLAKAQSQLEHTDPGLVKGKFGYLSPEAAYGESIDARTDLFAVGILLWEMLAADRLFAAETEPQTLELVRKAVIPPLRERNSEVPAELEQVIRRALARDRTRRYQRASELGNDLTHVLFDHHLRVTSSDVAVLVDAVREARGHHLSAPTTSQEHYIDNLIQDEIERFIPIDDLPFDASEGAAAPPPSEPLEDPSRWFDVDLASRAEAPAQPHPVEVHETRVGPTASPESLLIPIHVVHEAVAEAQRAGRLPPAAEPESAPDDAPAPPQPSGWSEAHGEGALAGLLEAASRPTPVPRSEPAPPSRIELAAAAAPYAAFRTEPSSPVEVSPAAAPSASAQTSDSVRRKGRSRTATVVVIAVLVTLGALVLSLAL